MKVHQYLISILIFIFVIISGPQTSAQQTRRTIQETIEQLADSETISQASVSICVTDGRGGKIVDINSEKMLVPASNMKLISTGAAIHHFGPEYRFGTSIGYDGEIIDGVLKGNVYIVGGGDPTLASKDSIATPLDQTFTEWTAMLQDAGITHIEGKIIGDGRYFDNVIEEPTWQVEDIGTYYGAGTTGLMFYENMASFKATAGTSVGDSVKITPTYPEVPWMEYRKNCSTGPEGTGDRLFLFTSELAPVAEIRGTFGVDRSAKRIDCSNKFPEYTCAYYFFNHLHDNGITCTGGIGDFRLDTSWKSYGDRKILGKTSSPELKRIIFETNHISNNVFAETLLRTLGKEMTGSACYDSSYVALNQVFQDINLDYSSGCRIKDGSGLSRQNYVSSEFLCRFLNAMMDSPYFEEFVNSLPSPGSNGTLQTNMKKYPAEIKDRIKVKSGSMNGIRCYSGYIIPREGCREDVIIFSLMINNCTSPTWEVRNLMDKMMAALAQLN